MQFQHQGKKNFDKFFDKSVINKIAKSSGFVQRKAKKIIPYHFVLGFIMSCCANQPTFSGWATQIGLLFGGNTVSKQGVFSRINDKATIFAKALLQKILLEQSGKNFTGALFIHFGKVLLQDSTTLRLPQILNKIFTGNHSRGEQKAVARIQTVIDIKRMKFIDFVLGSFTQNDQSASSSILQWVSKGDIVIRDLGYFAIATFAKLIKAEVYFLSRLRYGVKITDEQGKELALDKILRQGKMVDRWVFTGVEKKIKVRLVMLPLPKEQAAEKIRKAKQDRDKRLNHSKQYYQWLSYSIYITTVEEDIWTAGQVGKAYKVRWQIEMIFKSWKTGFHLQAMLHEGYGNEHRVRVSIYLMLLFMCLFIQKIYVKYKDYIERKWDKQISLIKLSIFICNNIKDFFLLPDKQIRYSIAYYCCYEKRTSRTNMTDLYKNFKN